MRYIVEKRRGKTVVPILSAPTFGSERDARDWMEAHPELIQHGLEAFELRRVPEETDG